MNPIESKDLFKYCMNRKTDSILTPVNKGFIINGQALTNKKRQLSFTLNQETLNQIKSRIDLELILTAKLTDDELSGRFIWPYELKQVIVNGNEVPATFDFIDDIQLPTLLKIKDYTQITTNITIAEELWTNKGNQWINQYEFYVIICHRSRQVSSFNNIIKTGKWLVDSSEILQNELSENNLNFLDISTSCPLSNFPIMEPFRFAECKHMQPMEIQGFLIFYSVWMIQNCPICKVKVEFNADHNNIIMDYTIRQMVESVSYRLCTFTMFANKTYAIKTTIENPFINNIANSNNNALQIQQNQIPADEGNSLFNQPLDMDIFDNDNIIDDPFINEILKDF